MKIQSVLIATSLFLNTNVLAQSAEILFLQGTDSYRQEDYVTAKQYWTQAADKGHAQAQFNLGIFAEQEGDDRMARTWYEKAATLDYAPAQFNLGVFYAEGRGGLDQNLQQAQKWYEKAAAQGYAEAQFNLGGLYYQEQNYQQAKKLYEQAANQDYVQAQFNLGLMYAQGKGVEPDVTQAIFWLEKASALGDQDAQKVLQAIQEQNP